MCRSIIKAREWIGCPVRRADRSAGPPRPRVAPSLQSGRGDDRGESGYHGADRVSEDRGRTLPLGDRGQTVLECLRPWALRHDSLKARVMQQGDQRCRALIGVLALREDGCQSSSQRREFRQARDRVSHRSEGAEDPSSLLPCQSLLRQSPVRRVECLLAYGQQPLPGRLLGMALHVLGHGRGRRIHWCRRSSDDECTVTLRQVLGEAQLQQGGSASDRWSAGAASDASAGGPRPVEGLAGATEDRREAGRQT